MSTSRTKQAAPMDIKSRFGFHATPFSREIAIEHRFRLAHLDETAEDLVGVIHARESGALIAPAGAGKTVVARTVRSKLPEARFDVRYIKMSSLSKRDMCRELALALGCPPAGTYPALVRRLHEHFESTLDSDGLRPVVILDDCHETRPETLGLVKVLTNFQMDSRLVTSFVLVGQPPLRRLLQRQELEDISRRLAHVAELRLLSREETRHYVEHRCTVAGSTTTPFDESAFDGLYELSRGNLRAIDRLALKSLELAAKAEQDVVDATHLVEARRLLWP